MLDFDPVWSGYWKLHYAQFWNWCTNNTVLCTYRSNNSVKCSELIIPYNVHTLISVYFIFVAEFLLPVRWVWTGRLPLPVNLPLVDGDRRRRKRSRRVIFGGNSFRIPFFLISWFCSINRAIFESRKRIAFVVVIVNGGSNDVTVGTGSCNGIDGRVTSAIGVDHGDWRGGTSGLRGGTTLLVGRSRRRRQRQMSLTVWT